MELMRIEDVAVFMKTTRKTIDKWLNTGTLPREGLTIKVGRSVYFDKDKLVNFLNTKTAS